MRVIIIILFIALCLLDTILPCRCASSEIPNCSFAETVNLTDSQRFPNGSYRYEGVLIPPHLIGRYDYVELYGGERQAAGEHIRGCACRLKPCVKFCCHPHAALYREQVDLDYECESNFTKKLSFSPYINITLHNNSQVLKHVLDEFVVQQGMPCGGGYFLMPELSYETDKWELFENGTLLRLFDQALFSTRDYCLQAYKTEHGKYVVNPMNCPITEEPPTLITTVLLCSLPFLLATILVYLCIPELHSLPNKCFICYLLSMALGIITMVSVNLQPGDYGNFICTALGSAGHFFFLGAFFWINVICFDIWYNGCLCSVPQLRHRQIFYLYSLYAWGLPALMTTVTVVLQHTDIPEELKSGIGYSNCWWKDNDWSAMIYFYGPCLLLIVFNMVIFFLTAMRIKGEQNRLKKYTHGTESGQHLQSHQNKVRLFLRLFIAMGINWILEIVGYLVEDKTSAVFVMADVFNASQGLIIFLLFVVKRNVLLLIQQRYIYLRTYVASKIRRES